MALPGGEQMQISFIFKSPLIDTKGRGRRQESSSTSLKNAQRPTSLHAVRPNHSLKLSANGMSRWPSSAGPSAHFALAVQRAMPSSPA